MPFSVPKLEIYLDHLVSFVQNNQTEEEALAIGGLTCADRDTWAEVRNVCCFDQTAQTTGHVPGSSGAREPIDPQFTIDGMHRVLDLRCISGRRRAEKRRGTVQVPSLGRKHRVPMGRQANHAHRNQERTFREPVGGNL